MEQLLELGKWGIITYSILSLAGMGVFIWFASKMFKDRD